MLKVGFIGLGSMGLPMAQNILKAGFPLWVYNRTQGKAAPLLDKGAVLATSASEIAGKCDVVVSMVANDEALSEIVEGIFRSEKRPSIHISMSTVSPALTALLETKHKERGIDFLAAPVSGRPERACQGALWIFLAGKAEAKKVAAPILAQMSCKVFDLGEAPQVASLFKLCNNFMILSLIESFSEASAMLARGGISMHKAAEVWGESLFDAPAFHAYTPALCNRTYDKGGFALKLGLKDMRLLQACADSAQVPMPFLSELHEKLIISMTKGREKFDWSAIDIINREVAGLE